MASIFENMARNSAEKIITRLERGIIQDKLNSGLGTARYHKKVLKRLFVNRNNETHELESFSMVENGVNHFINLKDYCQIANYDPTTGKKYVLPVTVKQLEDTLHSVFPQLTNEEKELIKGKIPEIVKYIGLETGRFE